MTGSSNTAHQDGCTIHQETQKVGIEGDLPDHNRVNPSSSNNEDSTNSSKEEDVLESAKAEMGEVRKENERLKKLLERMEKDYRSLQFRFFDILQNDDSLKKPTQDSLVPSHDHQKDEPDQLVSLCLGRNPCEPKKDDKSSSLTSSTRTRESEELKPNLTLGLDSKFMMDTDALPSNPSPADSIEEAKEEEAAGESKITNKRINGEEEVAQQRNVKRARVCVRARCDTPTINDGCQWRKYGQKISKGNPCPRAYYRCTVAPHCPVRKQVQRCVDDMSILITTYEGNHNHPLPVSATAMASTTSAAASMLLSGSSTSSPSLGPHSAALPAAASNSLYDSFRTNQFYLPTPATPLFPTITLDLTTAPFNKFSSSRFPSTSLSFSSSSESNTTTFPSIWGNNGFQNYGALPYNNQQQYCQPQLAKSHMAASQVALTETLTKAITSDPSFRTVLTTAISSMMGSNSSQRAGEILGQNAMTSQNGKACGSSYFSGLMLSSTTTSSPSSSQSTGTLLQPSLPFSVFNSASMSANNTEQKS